MEQDERVAQIMVVDDDPDTVWILARYLRREGFAAIEACSGAECLRLAKDYPVDLILFDLMMPDMDGFAVCRALKENPGTAEIPIILLTARNDVFARAEGLQFSVSDFLAKPIFWRQLAERIHCQLEMITGGRVNLAPSANRNGSNKT
jgi:DNA-binding response OmpR family regulator